MRARSFPLRPGRRPRRDAVEQSPDCGADDHAGLGRDRAQRHRVLQRVYADQRRRHGAGGGPAQRHRRPCAHRHRQIGPHVGRVRAALMSARPTPTAALSSSEPAKISRRGTRSASWPAGSASTSRGTNSASPIQPRSSGAPVQGVDLPPDHHFEHLQADPHPEQGKPPEAEVAHLERRPEPPHVPSSAGSSLRERSFGDSWVYLGRRSQGQPIPRWVPGGRRERECQSRLERAWPAVASTSCSSTTTTAISPVPLAIT